MAYLCSLAEACVSKNWKQELKSLNTCTQTYIGTFSGRLDKSWIHKTKAKGNPSDPSTQVHRLQVGAWDMQLSLTTGKRGRKGNIGMCYSPQGINFSGALTFDSALPPPQVYCQKPYPCVRCSADPGLTPLFSRGKPTSE